MVAEEVNKMTNEKMKYGLYRILICIAIWLATCCVSNAQHYDQTRGDNPESQTKELLRGAERRHSAIGAFKEYVYSDNPAAKWYQHTDNYTEISLNGEYKDEDEAFVLQQGTGYTKEAFRVQAYNRLNDNAILWGGASYTTGRLRDVIWNSSSDYELLFPYITADSVGGNLRHEVYSFAGGYAYRLRSKTTLGIYGQYRAQHEFRKVDPRPRNIVSDISATAGVSQEISPSYAVSVSFMGQIYRQNSSVSFYNAIGQTPQVLMLGMGVVAGAAYSGTNNLHEGYGSDFTLELVPIKGSGFSGKVAYRRFYVKRVLPSHNSLPITELLTRTYCATLSYTGEIKDIITLGIKGDYKRSTRDGVESVMGEPTGNHYPILAHLKMWGYSGEEYEIRGYAGNETARRLGWAIEPSYDRSSYKSEYAYKSRSMSIDRERYGVTITVRYAFDKARLSFKSTFDKYKCRDAQLDIPVANTPAGIAEMLQYSFGQYSSNFDRWGAGVRADLKLSAKLNFFVDVEGSVIKFKNNNKTVWTDVSIGLAF